MSKRLDEIKGNVKHGVGELTDNKSMAAEGTAQATSARTARHVEGTAKQAGGSIKAGVGALLGDKEMEARGDAEKTQGHIENTG